MVASRTKPSEPRNEKPSVYERLREMIVRGHVLPNERLVEVDFAKRLQTNRSSIRTALAQLESEGLVVCEPFRGARVRLVTEAEAVEILEVRAALEVLLVGYAAKRVTKADKERLQILQHNLRKALSTGQPFAVSRQSRPVREELWRISGHGTGARLLPTLNSQLVRYWYRASIMPGREKDIVNQIQAVVDAVCAGDRDKAIKAMRRYHDGAIEALKRAISARSSSALV